MDTKPLERFAQSARRQLHEQVAARLERVLRTDSSGAARPGRGHRRTCHAGLRRKKSPRPVMLNGSNSQRR